MINNNDVLKVITVKHFTYQFYLSRNVLHDEYFDEHTMKLKGPFSWDYNNCCRNIIEIKYIQEKR